MILLALTCSNIVKETRMTLILKVFRKGVTGDNVGRKGFVEMLYRLNSVNMN